MTSVVEVADTARCVRQDPSVVASKELRTSVAAALQELDRGREDPGKVTELVPALMRLLFVLFAEARGLLPARPLSRLQAELREGSGGSAWNRMCAVVSASTGVTDGKRGALAPRVSDAAALRALSALVANGAAVIANLDSEQVGATYESLLGLAASDERRRAGAHYTARAVTTTVVQRTLAPLVPHDATPESILSLAVCDPAMGSGAFLVEACRFLAIRLADAWARTGTTPALAPGEDVIVHARRRVARRCLYGVDLDPIAVELARLSLWIETAAREHPVTFLDHALRHGDALVGLSGEQIASGQLDVSSGTTVTTTRAAVLTRIAEATAHRRAILAAVNLDDLGSPAAELARADEALEGVRTAGDAMLAELLAGEHGGGRRRTPPPARALVDAVRGRHAPFHWEVEMPEVFAGERGGFDAIVGNPPWVSFAGRAAQPLAEDLRAFYAATSPAFHGYRNLQGVFVHRAATLLRPGGRLGLVLPTSMSDLGGYEPSRRAHDALCVCDEKLPDFGDGGFEGVFQPCMGLLSTRRAAPVARDEPRPWPLERRDVDADAARWLDHLAALPRLPAHLFGERGFQSMGDDVSRLRELAAPAGAFTTPLRVGGDIEPFLRRPARVYCDRTTFDGRFRDDAAWRAVKLLIRQTARYPMAAPSDGLPFRNSILAGFADEAHGEHLLLAWLNASPIRWYHYMRHRDARQGMPQLKIAHLRALPAPPRGAPEVAELERLGREMGERNDGIVESEQQKIDGLAAAALGLEANALRRIVEWARSVR
jgi:hypothetical protein